MRASGDRHLDGEPIQTSHTGRSATATSARSRSKPSPRYGDTTTQIRYVTQLGIYDQARQLEPRLRELHNDHRLGASSERDGLRQRREVLRRRGWTFPPLPECRAAWAKRYPGWKWRNPELTEWHAEESDVSDEADKMEGDDDPS